MLLPGDGCETFSDINAKLRENLMQGNSSNILNLIHNRDQLISEACFGCKGGDSVCSGASMEYSSPEWFKGRSNHANQWLKDSSTSVFQRKLKEFRGALHREFHGGVKPENPFVSKDPNTSATVEHLAYLNPLTGRIFRRRVIARAYDFKLFASPKNEKSLTEQYFQILDTLSQDAAPLRNANSSDTLRRKDFSVNLGSYKRAVVRKEGYRSFLDFRHLKSEKERLITFTLNQKQFRILRSNSEEIDRMIESKERGQIKLSSTCFVLVEQNQGNNRLMRLYDKVDRIEGRWSVDIRKYKLKKDLQAKGQMRSPTDKGFTLSCSNWGRLYLKLSAVGKAMLV